MGKALTVTIEIDVADAVAVGQNLRTLARDRRTPAGARASFDRVGSKLVEGGIAALQADTAVPK